MKLLVILPRFPYPTEKGDKLRAFNQLKILSRHHSIYLCAISHQKVDELQLSAVKPFCREIRVIRQGWLAVAWNLTRALFNGMPLQAGYYYSGRAHRTIRQIIRKVQPDHLYCQLLRTAAYVIEENIPKTIDFQDVFSKGIERRIPLAGFFMKPLLKLEYKRLLKFESQIFDNFDNKTIISKPDRDFIPHPGRDQILIVPNGVDHEYFRPEQREQTHELIFTGNMGYPPNINCAEYLAKKVLPIIHKTAPGVRMMLAGASPHGRVRALASESVTVTGWVDDLRACYASAAIFLAPMQIGTGLQNKLLEAMSMHLPCVTSSLCNFALNATPGKEILIGDTPEAVAEHVLKLLHDKDFRYRIAKAGYDFVQRNYSWEGATRGLTQILGS